jgi:hypothetical protein
VALLAAALTATSTTSAASALARSTSTIAAASVASSKSGSCDSHGAPQVFAGWPEQIREYDFAACSGFGPGASYSADVYATMDPAVDWALIGHLRPQESGRSTLLRGSFYVQYCSLPGGSDLPGADFRYKLVVNKPAHYEFPFQYTLPDDKTPPVLSVGSTPPHGSKVHPGEVIKVHITATEPTDRGPQEGIQDIQLLGPAGLVDSAQYGNHPKACDVSRLTKTFTTTYTVPNNPPPVIRLTAVAHDFANNESATLSADFYTGDVWTGTAHIVTHITYPPALHECQATEVDDYTFNLVVGAKGAVHGTDTKLAKVTSCGPTTTFSLRFPVSGQLTDTEFHFTDLYFVTVVPLSSSKTTAAAQFHGSSTTDGTTSTWAGTIKLTEA